MNRIFNFSEFNGDLVRSDSPRIFESNLAGTGNKSLKDDYDATYSFISDIYVKILINSIHSFIEKLIAEAESGLDSEGANKLSDCVQEMIYAYDRCIPAPLDSKFNTLRNDFINTKLPQAVPQRNPKIKYLSGSVISEYKKILDYFPRIIEIYDQDEQDIIQFGLSQDIDETLNNLTKSNESISAAHSILEKKSYKKEKYYRSIEDLSKRYTSLKNSLEKEVQERSAFTDRESRVLVSELKELISSLTQYAPKMDISQIGVHWKMSGKKILEEVRKISEFLDSVLNDMTDLLLNKINLTGFLQSIILKIEASLSRIDSLLESIAIETIEVTAADISIPQLDVKKKYPLMKDPLKLGPMPDGSYFSWDTSSKKWTWKNDAEYTGEVPQEFGEQFIKFSQPLHDVKGKSFSYDFEAGKWYQGSNRGNEITKENESAYLNRALEVIIRRSMNRWGSDDSSAAKKSYAKSMTGDSSEDLSFDNLIKDNPKIGNAK